MSIQMNLNQLIDIIIIKEYQKVKKIIKDKQEGLMLNNSNNITINIKNLSIMVIISLFVKHQMLIQIQISEILKVKECLVINKLTNTLKMTVKLLDYLKLH
jgi:predicted XRE-type DNA-binding protein